MLPGSSPRQEQRVPPRPCAPRQPCSYGSPAQVEFPSGSGPRISAISEVAANPGWQLNPLHPR